MQSFECCGHWFQGPGAPLGSRGGCAVGGERAFSVSLTLLSASPNPGKPGLSGSPFQVGLGVPRAALPSEGWDIKAAAAGSGCGRGGQA